MSSDQLKLWYRQPAAQWMEALPIGNGRLGAMVFGDAEHEHLQLNQATLWSGAQHERDTPGAQATLVAVRSAIFAGDFAEAEQRAKQLQGAFTQSYQPLGDLHLSFVHDGTIRDYYRDLDVDSAIATVQYRVKDTTFLREAFVSTPDQALVLHLYCDRTAQLNFMIHLDSKLRHVTAMPGKDSLLLTGKCPAHVEPSYRDIEPTIIYADDENSSLTFAACMRIALKGGQVTATAQGLQVTGATQATLFLTATTSFNGPEQANHPLDHIVRQVQAEAAALTSKIYTQLRAAHVADY